MVLVCIVFVFVVVAVILFSICASSSRIYRHIESSTFVFLPRTLSKPLENLLADGDMESVFRIMKVLEQRGEIHIVETESEFVITKPRPASEIQEEIPVPDAMP
jgi:hypothetical protein